MRKKYEVQLTGSEIYLLRIALGAQVIRDINKRQELLDEGTSEEDDYVLELAGRFEIAKDLAEVLGEAEEAFVKDAENMVVSEFVTNLDQTISEILK